MAFAELTTVGFAEHLSGLRLSVDGAPERALRALRELTEEIMTDSANIVPVDTGNLRASGFVEPLPDGAQAGYATDYALIVHENPNARHLPPTQYKYLEAPALRAFARVDQVIERALLDLERDFRRRG